MRISARNLLQGTVKNVNKGAVNSEVVIDLAGGESMVAIITNESTLKLGLKSGARATAVIKASDVMLGTGLENARISARNVLTGKVKKIEVGAVNSEVSLTLSGGAELVAIITKASAEHLALKPGGDAAAIVKASHVMVAVD
jgi:molybdate transport system regulatory protein